MAKVVYHSSVSLDGFVAGPNDEYERLFDWFFRGDVNLRLPGQVPEFKISQASADYMREGSRNVGAVVTGRHTFDVANAWSGSPPLGVHHFVVTHRVADEWVKPGSPFTFVTDGVESAIRQAKDLAGERDVTLSTASILQQALRAGLVDEIRLDLAAVLLGRGIPLFDPQNGPPVDLEILQVVPGTGVTHLVYRVVR